MQENSMRESGLRIHTARMLERGIKNSEHYGAEFSAEKSASIDKAGWLNRL